MIQFECITCKHTIILLLARHAGSSQYSDQECDTCKALKKFAKKTGNNIYEISLNDSERWLQPAFDEQFEKRIFESGKELEEYVTIVFKKTRKIEDITQIKSTDMQVKNLAFRNQKRIALSSFLNGVRIGLIK